MKRHGNLWPELIDFDNLLLAARNAQRGKRYRDNVLAFNAHLARNLTQLQTELDTRTYVPGGYRTFEIRDPKPRQISAAPYRDRVVHHALCNVIQWRIERSFIHHTYANRLGYGTHRALKHFTQLARGHRYILQCDIRKYFPSIDRTLLKAKLRRHLKCEQTLWLADTIIDASAGDRGLPIGNLTSQFFANLYLSSLDHLIKDRLKVRAYLRYVDDFALFANDRDRLLEDRDAIAVHLATLNLQLHPIKTQLFETRHGANFVGFRVLSDRIRVRTDNLQRSRHRLRQLQHDYRLGRVTLPAIAQRLQSWEAHLKHGDTHRLRQRIFTSLTFTR